MLTLYDCVRAPSPRRARILLAEKGVTYQKVAVDLGVREQLGEAYRAINPLCTVPALKIDDGTVLANNAAITAYLEERYPDPPLLGTTALEKADIADWNWRADCDGVIAVMEAFRNTSARMVNRALTGSRNYAQIPQLAARGLVRIDEFFAGLERRLEGRDYLAAGRFSVADITAMVAVDFAHVVHRTPDARFPNLLRWHGALAVRPSFSA